MMMTKEECDKAASEGRGQWDVLTDTFGRVVAPLTQAELTAHGELMAKLDRIIELLEAILTNSD